MARYFDVKVEGPVTVVKFTEKHLHDANIQEIASAMRDITEQLGKGELHLDFADVQYLSTAVMAKLLSMHKRITKEGGRFVLTNVEQLYELFSVTRLDTYLDIRRGAEEKPPAAP